jgi:hypothetical protein
LILKNQKEEFFDHFGKGFILDNIAVILILDEDFLNVLDSDVFVGFE